MTIFDRWSVIQHLSKHYGDGRLVPFIGAGFSEPLGLPSWKDLIGSIAQQLGFEQELFLLHGNYAQLAEFVRLENRRAWQDWINKMTVEFDSSEAIEKRKSSISHKALSSLKLRTIYTTNYDSHIEGALEDAGAKSVTLSSLADFLEPRDPEACEVIKFHGTLRDPKTLVLSESSYFDRMALEDAADQRLRSDILSNSFLFIGYSFNDLNIRYIWYKIHKLRLQQREDYPLGLRPSYFATFGANPVQPKLLEQWNINVIVLDPEDKSQSIADLLTSIKISQ